MAVLPVIVNNSAFNKSSQGSSTNSLVWSGCAEQVALVEMIAALRVLPLHSLVDTVKQVFKQPPVVENASQVGGFFPGSNLLLI